MLNLSPCGHTFGTAAGQKGRGAGLGCISSLMVGCWVRTFRSPPEMGEQMAGSIHAAHAASPTRVCFLNNLGGQRRSSNHYLSRLRILGAFLLRGCECSDVLMLFIPRVFPAWRYKRRKLVNGGAPRFAVASRFSTCKCIIPAGVPLFVMKTRRVTHARIVQLGSGISFQQWSWQNRKCLGCTGNIEDETHTLLHMAL